MCIELDGSDLQRALEKARSQGNLWIAFIKPLDWHFATLPFGGSIAIPGIIPPATDAILCDLTSSDPMQGLLLSVLERNQVSVFRFQSQERRGLVQGAGLSPYCKAELWGKQQATAGIQEGWGGGACGWMCKKQGQPVIFV